MPDKNDDYIPSLLKSNKGYNLFVLVVLIYLFFVNFPGWGEGVFFTDDLILFNQPYLKIQDFESFKTIFNFGSQVDYYPIRDLSTWIDWYFDSAIIENMIVPKIQNFIWFALSSFVLIKILVRLGFEYKLVTLVVATWLVHPIHFEMLQWASARKDVLSLFFGLLAIDFIIQFYQKNKIIYWIFGLIFFSFSSLSKAGFILVPGSVLLGLIYINKDKKWGNLIKAHFGLLILAIVGVGFAFIQFQNYTINNDVRMNFPFDYRLKSILAVLGRYFLGSFFSKYNTYDFEPWGNFGDNNDFAIPIGILVVILSIFLIITVLKSKNRFSIVLLSILAAILIMTPGLNPSHRNFYSVRYFEPIFLVLIIVMFKYFYNKLNSKYLVMLFVFFGAQNYLDSENWHSNLNFIDKSLQLTPDNYSLKYQKLVLLLAEYAHSRLSKEEIIQMQKLYKNIESTCLSNLRIDCKNTYVSYPTIKSRINIQDSVFAETGLGIAKDFTNRLNLILTPDIVSSIASRDIFYESLVGPLSEIKWDSLSEYMKNIKTFPKQESRVLNLIYTCHFKGISDSQALKNEYLRRRLLDVKTLHEYLSPGFPSAEVRDYFKKCFY